MYKKSIPLFLCLILLSICCGCDKKIDKSENDLELNSLLVSISDLPQKWMNTSIGPGFESHRSIDSIGVSFHSDLYPRSLGISQNVYRFKTESIAKYDFSENSEYYLAGEVPEAWTFKSEFADESIFSCKKTKYDSFPVCFWTARYHKITIVFFAWLEPGRLTLVDIEKIVKTIDSKIQEQISN